MIGSGRFCLLVISFLLAVIGTTACSSRSVGEGTSTGAANLLSAGSSPDESSLVPAQPG